MSPAKTSELIEMPFGWLTVVSPRNQGPQGPRGSGSFGELSGPFKSIRRCYLSSSAHIRDQILTIQSYFVFPSKEVDLPFWDGVEIAHHVRGVFPQNPNFVGVNRHFQT